MALSGGRSGLNLRFWCIFPSCSSVADDAYKTDQQNEEIPKNARIGRIDTPFEGVWLSSSGVKSVWTCGKFVNSNYLATWAGMI